MEKAYGQVKKIKGEYASVSIKRDSMCGDSCASCGMCGNIETVITVKNSAGAKTGDKVFIEMKDSGLLAATLVYFVPCLIIILGVIINSMFSISGKMTVILVVAFIILWYIILKFMEKNGPVKGKFGAEIISIESQKGDK